MWSCIWILNLSLVTYKNMWELCIYLKQCQSLKPLRCFLILSSLYGMNLKWFRLGPNVSFWMLCNLSSSIKNSVQRYRSFPCYPFFSLFQRIFLYAPLKPIRCMLTVKIFTETCAKNVNLFLCTTCWKCVRYFLDWL